MKPKKHLTIEGLSKIREIKSIMNKNRIDLGKDDRDDHDYNNSGNGGSVKYDTADTT